MTTSSERPPLAPGEPAPDFTLPAVGRDGTVSLDDYRGRSPVLLAMFRGLYCPFCRRAIAQLGVDHRASSRPSASRRSPSWRPPRRTRACTSGSVPRARPLAADPELITHRAYGLPRPPVTPELMQAMSARRVNPTGELPEPLPIGDAAKALDRIHGFTPSHGSSEGSRATVPAAQGTVPGRPRRDRPLGQHRGRPRGPGRPRQVPDRRGAPPRGPPGRALTDRDRRSRGRRRARSRAPR